jgi:hypothetical protein
MAMRYKVYRSADRNRHLILADDAFERVPAAIRDECIWEPLWSGDYQHLRYEYKRALLLVGYVVVERSAGIFSAEI